MIGKMFRPLEIINIPDKRGYKFLNKYKSNFAGIKKFTLDIFLDYDADTSSETINLVLRDLTVPLACLEQEFNKLSSQSAISTEQKYVLDVFRQMVRPTAMSVKEGLTFVMPIEASRDSQDNRDDSGKILSLDEFEHNKKYNDLLRIHIMPIVLDNREYMRINAVANTPISIHSNTNIRIIDGEVQ